MDPITIRYPIRPHAASLACAEVADLFGLAADEPPHVVAENVAFDLQPGQSALFVGPSGSGKSSLLRAVGAQLHAVDAAALTLPEAALVDALAGDVAARLDLLAACGLGEARLLLRRPSELSDGQRFRFRLALAVERAGPGGWVLADEFAALLDRTTAKVVAFNARKLAARRDVGLLAATTHDDLVDDFAPDWLVTCRGDGDVAAERWAGEKKNGCRSPTSSGCRTAPSPTGRTSRGGITAATTSRSSARS